MPNLAPYAVKDMASGGTVPEATYRLRINKFEYNDPHDPEWRKNHANSDAKEPFLMCDFVVQDETVPTPAGDVSVFGRHLFTPLTFKQGGDFMLRQLIESLGKDEDWMLVDMQGEPHWDELKDGEVLAVVTIQPARDVKGKDGQPDRHYDERNNVKKFLPLV
jgi:hypothetical protein